MPAAEQNTPFSNIQGKVSRVELLGELILTDTSYSPGLRLRRHAHALACFGVMLDGEFSERFPVGELSCGDRSVFFRPPELVHQNRVSAAGARCLYVEVSPRWLDHVEEYSRLPRDPMSFEGGNLKRIGNCLWEQWQEMDDVSPLAIEGLACEMAAQFCRTVQAKRESRPPGWLEQVRELLGCRFRDSLSLSDLSSEVRIHPVHIAREFRRYYGTTVGQFRRQCRIDFASNRLACSEIPIVDIALEAGFAQQAHFTNVFKRLTGLTPHRYRQLRHKNSRD